MARGSATSILVFPKQHLCIVVLTNLQAKDDPVPVDEGLAKFYLPDLNSIFDQSPGEEIQKSYMLGMERMAHTGLSR